MTDYEALRGDALGGHGGASRLGLALFVRRGMAAWMRAWAEVKEVRGPRGREGPGREGTRPVAAGEELVLVLATMALSAREEA